MHELYQIGQASPAAQRRLHQLAPSQQVPQIELPGAAQGSKGMLHIDAVVQGSHEGHHVLQAGGWEGRVEGTCRHSVRAQSHFMADCTLARQPHRTMRCRQAGRLQGKLKGVADWGCSQRRLHVHSNARNLGFMTAASCQG